MRPIILGVLASVVALGASACTGASSDGASPTSTAAATPATRTSTPATPGAPALASSSAVAVALCKTSNQDEIKGLFGGSVAVGSNFSATAQPLPSCHWRVTGSNLGSDGTVVVAAADAISGVTKFDAAKQGVPQSVDIAGVGDAAFYSSLLNSLYFRKGDKAYLIQGIFVGGAKPDPAKIQADLTSLAGDVAGRV